MNRPSVRNWAYERQCVSGQQRRPLEALAKLNLLHLLKEL